MGACHRGGTDRFYAWKVSEIKQNDLRKRKGGPAWLHLSARPPFCNAKLSGGVSGALFFICLWAHDAKAQRYGLWRAQGVHESERLIFTYSACRLTNQIHCTIIKPQFNTHTGCPGKFARVKREAGLNPAQQPLLCFVMRMQMPLSQSLRRRSRGSMLRTISQETCLV